MDDRVPALADQLLLIERELRVLGVWASSPPAPEALASQEPFCVDTLSFELANHHSECKNRLLKDMKYRVRLLLVWVLESFEHLHVDTRVRLDVIRKEPVRRRR